MSNPIICGPMLRKVTKDSVSVFIALDAYSKVTLQLSNQANGLPILATKEVDPKRIGKKLWVIVITLNTSNLQLEIGKNYYYNIILSSQSGVKGQSLSTLGFLDSDNPILGLPLGYEEGVLPSFSLPPTLENLNIIHGSCRKPHGGGEDQLADLDNLILEGHNNPLKRPHQLFLTGDQIYADDVAPELLVKLTKESRSILGISEKIILDDLNHSVLIHDYSGVNQGEIRNKEKNNIDNRSSFIEKSKFTSGESDYHLIFLAEFYSMYLFVWSGYPIPSNKILSSTINSIGTSNIFSPFYHYKNNFLNTMEDRGRYEKIASELTKFCKGLSKVRRALANIPTYMMFDDHDVTDDWYIDRKWKEDALENSLSKRVIKNALVAYSIFQDWGNQPEKYINNKYFWNAVEYKENNNPQIEFIDNKDSIITNDLENFLGLTSSNSAHWWNYHIEFKEHEIFTLDTRTRRYTFSTGNKKDFVALIQPSKTSLEEQLPKKSVDNKLAIIISPAPVLGMPIIEDGVQRWAVESIPFRDRAAHDYESWSGDPSTFNLLLEHLSQYKSTIILSGDVHYGYTNSCSYFSGHGDKIKASRIIQLCSSSLKNTGFLSHIPTRLGGSLEDTTNVFYSSNNLPRNNLPKYYKWIQTSSDLGIQKIPLSKYYEFQHRIDATNSRSNPNWWFIYQVSNFDWLNPRLSSIFTFPIDVPRYCSENLNMSLNIDSNETRGLYTIEYLHHDELYNSIKTTDKNKRNKIFPNTNIGQINFNIEGSKIYVIHKITNRDKKRSKKKEHHMFYCKTLITPPSINGRPKTLVEFRI